MNGPVVIDRRFHGPPDRGNGGYVCGVVAGFMDGTAEVTLRRPPPLDTPLRATRHDDVVVVHDGDTVIAEGAPTSLEIDVPQPVTLADAEAASRSYFGLSNHIFPECFVCGPGRAEGDGLRIFAGWVRGGHAVAAPWTPHPSLAGPDRTLSPEFVWAALDCPGGWSLFPDPGNERRVVLGRMAARLLAPVRPEERCVVVGWPLLVDGRKLHSGTALFAEDGRLLASARATWVRLG